MGSILACPNCSAIAYMKRGWFAELTLFIFVEIAFVILLVASIILWGDLLLGLVIFIVGACLSAWRRIRAPLHVVRESTGS